MEQFFFSILIKKKKNGSVLGHFVHPKGKISNLDIWVSFWLYCGQNML